MRATSERNKPQAPNERPIKHSEPIALLRASAPNRAFLWVGDKNFYKKRWALNINIDILCIFVGKKHFNFKKQNYYEEVFHIVRDVRSSSICILLQPAEERRVLRRVLR
jgi:hypothetical protein